MVIVKLTLSPPPHPLPSPPPGNQVMRRKHATPLLFFLSFFPDARGQNYYFPFHPSLSLSLLQKKVFYNTQKIKRVRNTLTWTESYFLLFVQIHVYTDRGGDLFIYLLLPNSLVYVMIYNMLCNKLCLYVFKGWRWRWSGRDGGFCSGEKKRKKRGIFKTQRKMQ